MNYIIFLRRQMDFGAEIFTAVCRFSWNLGALTLPCLIPKIQFVWLSVSAVHCPQAQYASFAPAQLEAVCFSTVQFLVHKHKHSNTMCVKDLQPGDHISGGQRYGTTGHLHVAVWADDDNELQTLYFAVFNLANSSGGPPAGICLEGWF